jgi:hypothetical protein
VTENLTESDLLFCVHQKLAIKVSVAERSGASALVSFIINTGSIAIERFSDG